MTFKTIRVLSAISIFAVAFMAGCGSDSTGPGSVDATAALQSLALGLQTVGGTQDPTAPDLSTSLGAVAPLLSQVSVTIDGASQNMFAFGLRETFPAGTCEETLFPDPLFPPEPGVCTPPPLGLSLILWQSHAATEPPDRMILVVADAGTSNFDFSSSTLDVLPAFAIYIQGQDNIWGSLSGSLTSQVGGGSQTCDIPLPPYAKNGACSIATFDEQGSIVFEEFTLDAPSTQRLTIAIPHQTLHGLWLAITEVQPVPFTANRLTSGFLGARVNQLRARVVPGLSRKAPNLIPAR
ncbi:MAG TPA: hypothetical protein VK478_08825 [Gemmatimonadaceae bacterium]|nr:hypothetical protein [Gemmatimonadaceae bacterium]